MDNLQLVMAVRATTDIQRGPRDAHERPRIYTIEELDALADFEWPWAGVTGCLAAGATAVLSRLRPRASSRIEPTRLPSASATAKV